MHNPFDAAVDDAADLPSPRELAISLAFDRRRIAAVGAAVFGVFALAALLINPGYRAQAMLAVMPAPEFTARPQAGTPQPLGGALSLDQIMKAETEILKSDALAADVLHDVGVPLLFPDLAARLADVQGNDPNGSRAARLNGLALLRLIDDTDITASKDGNVLTIAVTHPVAAVAARAVRAFVADYARRREAIYTDPQLPAIERQDNALRQDAENALARLVWWKDHVGIANFDLQRDQLLAHRAATEAAMREAQADAAEQQARLDSLADQRGGQHRTALLYREADPDTRRQSLLATIEAIETKIDGAATRYQPDSRMLTDLRAQLAAGRAELRRLDADNRPSSVRTGPNPVLDGIATDISRATTELAAQQARADVLRRQGDAIDAALKTLGGQEVTIQTLASQRSMAEEAYHVSARVLQERRLTEAEDARRLANVRVIAPPRLPLRPRPLRAIILGAGLVLALLAAGLTGFFGFIGREVFLTEEALARATGLPVLGVMQPADLG